MDQVADDDDRICRVCRSEASHDKPLYHPCICTGSIRYVHQDCLVQWLSHSKKEYCELCKYKYSFKPIYSPDMPSRLPVKDLVCGLFRSIFKAVKSWLHYTLVAIAWLGVVPLTACRIYKCLFTGSVASLMTLPMDLLSTAHIGRDIVQGSIVVACSMTSFIGLVWLREQIMNGGIPGWLAQGAGAEDEAAEGNAQAADPVINDDNNNVNQENVDEEGALDVNQDIQLDQEDESSEDEEGDADTVAFLEEGSDAENENILEQDGEHQIAEEDQDDHFNEIPVVNMEEELPAPPNNQQDMLNWNALEWDRAAEELTWERMLGLDGSLVFLEHVFWVVSLNTLFILIFAFCPYHLGHFFLVGLDLDEYVIASRFEGLLTTLFGYLILTIGLFICHVAMFLLKMHRSGQVLGIFYIILKVAMLIMGEMGVFPLVCGWWLDVCSLQLLNATVQDRTRNYMNAPCTSAFFHWLIGMIYVFYFASFLLLLREVLRPGALWFLRNLNDPDFNPIQEMIHLPMYRHIRRFLLSIVIFGTAVLMVIYAPVRCIQRFLPGFLPYKVIIHRDAPVSDLSLELILLQVILPALLEQGQTRQWLKVSVWTWANLVGNFLGLKSYLLGDETDNADDQADNPQGEAPPGDPEVPPGDPEVPPGDPEVPPVPPPPFPLQQHLHPPPPMGRDGNVHQPYTKPSFFTARIILLILTMCLTLCLASLSIMVVPVGIGRYLFNLWLGVNSSHIHDLYPTALGLYVCWLFGQTIHMVLTWLPQGGKVIWSKMKQLFRTFLKTSVVLIFAIGIFPLLFGLALELVVVIPLRVPLHQTPILFLWQDWVLGILIVKLVVASTLLGPQWMVRVALERAYQQGINNFELKEFYFDVIHPILCGILLCLSVPYVLAQGVIHSFDLSFENSILLSRRIYPMLISLAAVVTFLVFEARQFRRLCDHIKNERYLVGKKLINYDPEVST